ncbi:MAG: DUF1080 domain-containing protein [Phycisphaerales bacterium]|nr:DUF1080 domain-containing protein [Phycisphaerales bacterium]
MARGAFFVKSSGAIRRAGFGAAAGAALLALAGAAERPVGGGLQPPVVTPGRAGSPPSDAVVLFDGTSLDGWTHGGNRAAEWIIEGDAMVVKPGSGSLISRATFGDAQFHLEFATPVEVHGEGQERGNSGLYIQGRYEVQILDSFENETYPDGQCSAIYGQYAPLANASRPPGEWQTYDVIFRAAKFDADGKRLAPATITVLHNGVLTQDCVELKGVTGGALSAESADPGPIMLQDHGNRMRFRTIWVRPLP